MKTKFVNDPNDNSGEFCGPITRDQGHYTLEYKGELLEVPASWVAVAVVDAASVEQIKLGNSKK